jgi:phosphoenolpyruvate carboxylase
MINPIFYKMTFFTSDYIWKGVFYKLAYSDPELFKLKVKFYNDIYTINIKDEECYTFSKFLINDNKNVDTFIKTFQSHYQTLQISKRYLKFACTEWSHIKKKSLQRFLIENYILNTYDKLFSIRDLKKIMHKIQTCIVFKNILKSDIIFDNGKIQKIIGIDNIILSI